MPSRYVPHMDASETDPIACQRDMEFILANPGHELHAKAIEVQKVLSNLRKVSSDHVLYQESGGKEGAIANLRCADLGGTYWKDISLSLHGANLRGVDLREADLMCTNWSGADLRGANLDGAFLSQSNWSGADLRGANLCEADLRGASWSGADLREADLSYACLRGADFSYADLRGADLRYARLGHADLGGAKIDLSIEDGLLRRVALKVLGEKQLFRSGVWCNSREMTHSIAGYAVSMSKDREIEGKYGMEVAALMLLGVEASEHFFDCTKDALKWLEEVAGRPVTSS